MARGRCRRTLGNEMTKRYSNALLPDEFDSVAYLSPNGQEFALPRDAAVAFLRRCQQNGIQVLGFDVWLPTEPKPTDFFSENCEGDAESCLSALGHIDDEAIERKHGCKPVFNIWTNEDKGAQQM